MRKRGLITKDRDEGDARVVNLALTDEGWSVLERAMPKVFEAEKAAVAAPPTC